MIIRIIILVYFFSCSCKLIAQETSFIEDSPAYYINKLDSLANLEMYEEALPYVEALKTEKGLSPEVLQNCVICYESAERYKECIDFCDFRLQTFPEDDFLLFYSTRGECYYFLNEPEKALEYISEYIDLLKELNLNPSIYYIGLYADILYETFNYNDAEKYYILFFENIAKEENLTLETIYTSHNSKSYGFKLYNYAYNCFFQGKEKEGYGYLLLSKKCGNEAAIDDCKKLEQSSTFAKEVKYKSETIRDYKKQIQLFNLIPNEEKGDASFFWNYVQDNNKPYQDFYAACTRDKQTNTIKKVLSQLNENKPLLDKTLYETHPYKVGSTEIFLNNYLCGNKSFLKELRIYPAKDPNAFATPYGDIYLTDGLVELYHFNNAMLLGVCAHEATHYICQHFVVGQWKQAKKEKKNEILAGIAVGLNTIGHSSAAMMGASSGASYDDKYWDEYFDSVNKLNNSLIQGFKTDAFYFQFKYGRAQELESDIIAYRFCEYMGIGGYAYIMALQLLGDGNGYLQVSKDSDHPTNAFRIGLLKFLYKQEHGDK